MPKLPEVAGRFESVTIAEQIVDSAVYRFGPHLSAFRKDTDESILAGSSVNQSKQSHNSDGADDSHASG